ncbi:MAG: hybrid sensor histidine kinase/response regulator [Verrucomicrobiia bacterium]
MTTAPRTPATIMLVDDVPENLRLLEFMLREGGVRVRSFHGGRLALAAADREPPDLVLLDIRMTEMDGYETCRRLKADPRLAAIPVIFISGASDPMDKVKAFECGGVDYVTKPFQTEEVMARIETHLKLRQLQKEMEEINANLAETVYLKTRQLSEAHARLTILDKAKDDFLKLISHELRTPLHGLFGVGELLLCECPENGSTRELRELFQQSQRRLLTIIEDALLLTQIEADAESFTTEMVPIHRVVGIAADLAADFARSREVRIELPPMDARQVRGDSQLSAKAIQALMETAVKFSTVGGAVRVALGSRESEVLLIVEATGRNIPADALPRFFQVLAIQEAITPGGDLGLAPPLAQRILALFGGEVAVENRVPPGIRFTVRFKDSPLENPVKAVT